MRLGEKQPCRTAYAGPQRRFGMLPFGDFDITLERGHKELTSSLQQCSAVRQKRPGQYRRMGKKFLLHLLFLWSNMEDCRNEGEVSVKATSGR